MSFGKIKLDKADIEFSKFIRLRDKKCMVCGRKGSGSEGIYGLECSHFFSRRKETTRFDPENADALCTSCHFKFEHEKGETVGLINGVAVKLPKEYRKWKIGQLGMTKFRMLEVRANMIGKKDRKLALIIVKKMLADLLEKRYGDAARE